MSRAEPPWKPWIAVLFALGALLAVPAARSGPSPQISVDYSIEGGAYDNAARVGNVTDMEYPRVAIDRDAGSSFYGTIYVAGLDHFTCGSLILSRSTDGGRTFEAPHPVFAGCLTGYLDLVVGPLGVLYAATWGATILQSIDGGTTWEILAILDPTGAPTFLTLDRTTGRVIAAWVPFDIQSPPGPILVASSQNAGVTWTQPTSILPAGTSGELEQIAARGNHVVVSFIAKGSPDPYVAATASHDGGVTWSTPTPLTEATPCMEAPPHRPSRSHRTARSPSRGTRTRASRLGRATRTLGTGRRRSSSIPAMGERHGLRRSMREVHPYGPLSRSVTRSPSTTARLPTSHGTPSSGRQAWSLQPSTSRVPQVPRGSSSRPRSRPDSEKRAETQRN